MKSIMRSAFLTNLRMGMPCMFHGHGRWHGQPCAMYGCSGTREAGMMCRHGPAAHRFGKPSGNFFQRQIASSMLESSAAIFLARASVSGA